MRAYVLAVGSELLGSGRSDTNSLWLAGKLAEFGVPLVGKGVVGDDMAALQRSLAFVIEQADLVVVTGGLGPTSDDLTREAVAGALGLELQHSEPVAESIESRFAELGVPMATVNLRQAMVPQGAKVLHNPRGTAPGLWIEAQDVAIVLLPGVPREMKGLAESDLFPWVAENTRTTANRITQFRVACLPESTVEERLVELYRRVGKEQVTVLSSPGDIRIEVREAPEAQDPVDLALITSLLGDAVYSQGAPLEQVVVEECVQRELKVAVAESCTGGQLCARLTSVPGASAVVLGGVVAYDNRIKNQQVGVSEQSLQEHGAVSEQVAVELAEGARVRFAADIGVAVTGIAGPTGGSEEKPVGTVWFAWSFPDCVDSGRRRFPGDRDYVRAFASQWALDGIRRRLT